MVRRVAGRRGRPHDGYVSIATRSGSQENALLEREAALEMLGRTHAETSSGRGRLVFVAGEAGVGKTTLLRHFVDGQPERVRVLWGSCDSLFTPRALGPLLDVAHEVGGEFARSIVSGATPHDVYTTLVQELDRAPTVLVLEDVHWADEATLDVLLLLGRRLETCPALVLASYRADELERAHQLQVVLGQLALVREANRLNIEPLSFVAVANLAEEAGNVDPHELYRKTGGNPFFVTEVLLAREEIIPATVRDAVLARVSRLSAVARRLLDLVAVAHQETEVWLIESAAPLDALDDCLESGMLVAGRETVAFRHEIARLAVEESIPPGRARELHRTALATLRARPAAAADLARLAHHAEGAGDAPAVLELAPAAARLAASVGAHREAVAQYARTLRFSDTVDTPTRAGLLTMHSYECYLTAQDEPALESIAAALGCYRELGDDMRVGATLRWQALAHLNWGRGPEAARSAHEAVEVLERLAPSHELAMSYNALASSASLDEDRGGAIAWADKALRLAEQIGSSEARMAALGTIGVSEAIQGSPQGWDHLHEAVALARAEGNENQVGRNLVLLGMAASRERSLTRMRQCIEPALEFCVERDLGAWEDILLAMRGWLELEEGDWDAAAATAKQSLARDCRLSSAQSSIVLGVQRARRGDPDPWAPLEQADEISEQTGQLWWTAQVAAAKAEVACLQGRPDVVADATNAAFEAARERRASWPLGELAFWRRMAGIEEELPDCAGGPFATQLRGEWELAAEQWAQAGCPYEGALAYAEGDVPAQQHALEELNRLGAKPAASIVARRLRQRGVQNIARGPRPTTRENPAQLTNRELEVLRLIADGLRNAEIATRLVVSKRTVDHHVSAILRKLGARTRSEAVARTRALGLLQDA